MAKKPYSYVPATVEEPSGASTDEPPMPVFEAPPVAPEEEAPPAPVATNREDDALAKRLTDYVHHRLNQHLPTAVEFYVQELREVISGKPA